MLKSMGLLGICAALTLTACGDKDDTDTSGGEADTDTDTDSDTDTDTDSDTDTDTDTDTDMTCQTDICTTYGAAVPAVASGIVDAAAKDPEFSDDFAPLVKAGPDAVDDFKESLANFISDAYGCSSGAYTGPSMVDAHTGMGITQAEYDAFIGLIAGVLSDAGVPDDDINYCFAPPLVDPAFSGTIVGQ